TAAFAGGAMLAFSLAAMAQSGNEQPRTPWGDPDLSGVYSEYTTAPLERPERFGEREFLTDEEFAELERRRLEPRAPQAETQPGTRADVHYNMDTFALDANEGF